MPVSREGGGVFICSWGVVNVRVDSLLISLEACVDRATGLLFFSSLFQLVFECRTRRA